METRKESENDLKVMLPQMAALVVVFFIVFGTTDLILFFDGVELSPVERRILSSALLATFLLCMPIYMEIARLRWRIKKLECSKR